MDVASGAFNCRREGASFGRLHSHVVSGQSPGHPTGGSGRYDPAMRQPPKSERRQASLVFFTAPAAISASRLARWTQAPLQLRLLIGGYARPEPSSLLTGRPKGRSGPRRSA